MRSRSIARPRTRTEGRLGVLVACIALAGLVVVARLAKIQLVDHHHMASLAKVFQIKRESLQGTRGRILDRHASLLAFTTENPSIYADRARVENPEAVAAALVSFGLPVRKTRERLAGTGHACLTRDLLPEPLVHEVVGENPGLYVQREPKRIYPRGSVGRQVIGRWSDDADLLTGVERKLDDVLTGESGWETYVRDGRGGQYATTSRRAPRPGSDIELTLDRGIQEIAESALAACVDRHDADGGVVIVMEPNTGEVLAMASHGTTEEGAGFINRAITHPVEIGSCAKLVAAAAALDLGVCDTTTAFYCGRQPGEVDPPLVRDDHGAPGWHSFQMVIAESRNTGTARIARRVGRERFYDALRRFGFGVPTGIEQTGESGGFVRAPDQWSGTSLDAMAIGYEFLATPLQWATAYASVANGGKLLRPRLVREFRDPDTGTRRVVETEVVRRVMSERTAQLLRGVFHRVTEPGGTGTAAALPWVRVAGKTGTARKLEHEAGTYGSKAHVASFVGFAPAESPKILCLVMIDEPKDQHYGGEVAAPVFREVMERVGAIYPGRLRQDVRRLVVAAQTPTAAPGEALAAPPRHTRRELPDFRGLATLPARRLGVRRGYKPEVIGRGERVVRQEPAPGSAGAETIVLYTAGEAPSTTTVPDLIGLGYRRAIVELGAVGLDGRRKGFGRVVAQSPLPGSLVAPNTTVALTLQDLDRDWGGP